MVSEVEPFGGAIFFSSPLGERTKVRGKHPAFIRYPTLIIAFIFFVSVVAVDGGLRTFFFIRHSSSIIRHCVSSA
jgi:hypothetical protein